MPGGLPVIPNPWPLSAAGESEVWGRRSLKVLSREEDGPQLGTALTALGMVHKDSGLDRFGEELILISVARPVSLSLL